MKQLKIDEQVEKHLISIFDAALKNAGFALHQAIQFVMSKVEDVAPKLPEDERK